MISKFIAYIGAGEDNQLFTLAKGKEFMRVEFNHEDDLIQASMEAAIKSCEDFTKRSFLLQRRMAVLEAPRFGSNEQDTWGFFGEGMTIHYGPVKLLESLQPVAKGANLGAALTLGVDYWETDGKLYMDKELLRERFREEAPSHLTLTYQAGMEKAEFNLSYPSIVEAVKMTLHNAWDGRGFNSMDIPPQARQKLAPYRNIMLTDV